MTHDSNKQKMFIGIATILIAAIVSLAFWRFSPIIALVAITIALHVLFMNIGITTPSQKISRPDDYLRLTPHQRDTLIRFQKLVDMTTNRRLSITEADYEPLSIPSEADVEDSEDIIPAEIIVTHPEITQAELGAFDVNSIFDLADISVDTLTELMNVDDEDAEEWILNANLLCYGARVTSLVELASSTPEEIVLRISNSPWNDIYGTEEGIEYLKELAAIWIQKANDRLAKDSRELLKRTRTMFDDKR